MSEKPKLETVAKRAGVSTATASQVMRGTGRISEKTRKMVLRVANELHYVPDGRAASMRSGQNRDIGFVINQISNPFNAEVISGVSDLLEAEGFLVSVLDARDDPDRQRRHIEAFIRNGRGGLLWVPALDTPTATFDLLAAHKTPTVTFLRRPKHQAFDHVGIRNFEATRTATQYLSDFGHQHIAYFGGTELTDVRRDRIAGYEKALEERGLGSPVVWESEDNKLAGLNAFLELLQAHPEITAIVCNGDVVALGACLALIRSGKAPGKDVSVVGFDDIQDAAVATPSLTTMTVSPYHLGRRLARVLLDRIREPDTSQTVVEVSAELIVRETVGKRPENSRC
jgi:LacI family transcriptional regulator